MGFESIAAGFLAGILSTLSPCVLPILPIVLGAAASAHRAGVAMLVLGMTLAFTAAGLFVATIGFSIGLDGNVLRFGSAVVLAIIGLVLMSKALQARLTVATGGASGAGHHLLQRISPGGMGGQFCVGAILGLVWSPCVGPTLGAASLLASRRQDLGGVAAVMIAFGLGTAVPLLVIAGISRQATLRWRGRLLAAGQTGRLLMGAGALAVAALILTGADRRLETMLVDVSPAWLTDFTTRF